MKDVSSDVDKHSENCETKTKIYTWFPIIEQKVMCDDFHIISIYYEQKYKYKYNFTSPNSGKKNTALRD